MSILPILIWPDARLGQVCAPVGDIGPGIRALADDMLETMYAAPGRGLAGPQVGAMLRIFVMDVDWRDGVADPRVFVNPQIESAAPDTETGPEGCLSIPGLMVEVTRPAAIRLCWTGLDGAAHAEVLTGFAAKCVQHEIDHLDGIVTLDRADPALRAELEATYLP